MKVIKLSAHEMAITVVKFNYDGDLLFTASSDRKVNLWNSLTGERLGSINSRLLCLQECHHQR